MNMKKITIVMSILFLVASFVLPLNLVKADTLNPPGGPYVNDGSIITFEQVKINGINVFIRNTTFQNIYVYPGENLSVIVYYKGVKNVSDATFVFTIPGYEYKFFYKTKNNIKILANYTNYVSAKFQIPKDMPKGDYFIRIELQSKEGTDYIQLPIRVDTPSKYILTVDADVFPKLLKYSFKCNSCAENKYKVLVRVENRGDQTLKHVNVEAYLQEYPELTLTKIYLYDNTDDQFNGQLAPGEVATLTGYIDLNTIPFPLKTGTYHVVVKVNYDYNHKNITKIFPVQLVNIDEMQEQNNKTQNLVASPNTIDVSINPPTPLVLNGNNQGEYNLTIINKANARTNVKVQVETLPQVNYQVIPPKVSIEPLGRATVQIKLIPQEEGVYPVKIKLLNDNGEVIKVIDTKVEYTSNNLQNLVIAVIIFILIIVIFLIIALILKKNLNNKYEKETVIIEKEKGPNIKVEEEELY
jgi:preprotein translocase subunit SecG